MSRALTGTPATFLLERAADDVEDRIGAVLRPFHSVLDMGTPGAGLARRLRHSMPAARIVAASASAGPGVDLLAEADLPPFGPERFDLVVSAFALHQVDDLPGALAQMRRILLPDGLFLACLPGGETLIELRQALAAAEAEIAGGMSPRVMPFADLRDLGTLLQRAGFALPVVDGDRVTVRYPTMFALMADLRAMGATNVLIERVRHPSRRSLFLRAAAIYAERFADTDGRVRATFDLLWMAGWAPHASQQQPLRPGSARMRLAEALNAVETSAGEKP